MSGGGFNAIELTLGRLGPSGVKIIPIELAGIERHLQCTVTVTPSPQLLSPRNCKPEILTNSKAVRNVASFAQAWIETSHGATGRRGERYRGLVEGNPAVVVRQDRPDAKLVVVDGRQRLFNP